MALTGAQAAQYRTPAPKAAPYRGPTGLKVYKNDGNPIRYGTSSLPGHFGAAPLTARQSLLPSVGPAVKAAAGHANSQLQVSAYLSALATAANVRNYLTAMAQANGPGAAAAPGGGGGGAFGGGSSGGGGAVAAAVPGLGSMDDFNNQINAQAAGSIGNLEGLRGNYGQLSAQTAAAQQARLTSVQQSYQQALDSLNKDLGAQGAGSVNGQLGLAQLQAEGTNQQNLTSNLNNVFNSNLSQTEAGVYTGAGVAKEQAALANLLAMTGAASGGSSGRGGGFSRRGGGGSSGGYPTPSLGDAAALAEADTPINARATILSGLGGYGTNPLIQKFVSTTLAANAHARQNGGKQHSLLDAYPQFIASVKKANGGKVPFNTNKAGGALARAVSKLQGQRQKASVANNKAKYRGL